MTQNGAGPESSHSSTSETQQAVLAEPSMVDAPSVPHASSPGRHLRRWWRYLLVGTGISMVLLTLLLVFLPQILKPVLNRWTPDALAWLADIDGEVQIRHWDWEGLDIEYARMALDDGTEIRLSGLALRFTPEQLVNAEQLGQIQSATLDSVDITLQQSGEQVAVLTARQAGEAAKQRLQSSELVVPDLPGLLKLPIERVLIRALNLHHQQATAHLTAELTPARWHLGGNLELADVGHPWQLELQLHQRGDWIVQLADGEQLLMQTFAAIQRLESGNTRIELRQQWQADELQHRFPLARDLPALLTDVTLTATTELPPVLRIPQDLVLQARLMANTRSAALVPEWRWQSGKLALDLNKDTAEGDWNLKMTTSGLKLASTTEPVRSLSQPKGALTIQCPPALEQCELQGSLPLRVRGNERVDISLKPELQLQSPTRPDLIQVTGAMRLGLDARVPVPPESAMASISSHGRLNLEASLRGGQLTSRGFSLKADVPDVSGWRIGRLNGRWGQKLSVQWEATRTGQALHAAPVTLTLQPVQLDKDDIQLNLDTSGFSCIPALTQLTCDLTTALFPSRAGDWPLPDARIESRIELGFDDLALNARLKVEAAKQQLKLRGFVQHQLDNGQGALQWHLQQARLNWDDMGLAEMSTLTSVQLLGGQVSGQGWVDWSLDSGLIQPDVMLRGDDISLIYDNSIAADHWSLLLSMQPALSGVGSSSDSLSGPATEWVVDTQLSGESLNAGVELTDMLARSRLRLSSDWYELNLYEIHMNLLGGQIQVPAARFDSRKDINAFGVELYRLQLKELAALEPNAGIEASGVLDGVLPVVLTPEGPTVPGGNLFARPPGGILRYNTETSASLKQTDPTVGLAMQALENFHYTELSSGIQYQSDGALNLALKFQGANPDFFDGQSTHLNVNLDYNLLDLLESLRVANDVISRLEEKYQ